MQKCVFNKVAMSVKVLAIASLLLSVFAWRDPLSGGLLNDSTAVVALVSQLMLGTESFKTVLTACNLRWTLRNNDSDRHTKRIHGER